MSDSKDAWATPGRAFTGFRIIVVVGMDKAGKASSVHWSDGRDRADQQTKNREHGEQARLHDVLP